MLEELRSGMAAIIREDLSSEAAQGFPLLKRFPNSEIASVPGHFAGLGQPDRELLLDTLARYSTIQWSHDVVRERKAHPILGPYLARRPLYPPGDWYGERPRKAALKRSVTARLTQAGFVRKKQTPDLPVHVVRFSHPEPDFEGHLVISFNPGLLRQLDFGFRDWLRGDLKKAFELPDPRAFIPVVGFLGYDHLWDGRGTNNPVCWDNITEKNLEETGELVVEVANRLTALAKRINERLPVVI
jgi:hypothetical protein